MRIITCFGDRTCSTFLGLSDEDNSVSQTDNFVNVFNSVASLPVLSYHCVLHYFSTISSVGFHFNLRGEKLNHKSVAKEVSKPPFFAPEVQWASKFAVFV